MQSNRIAVRWLAIIQGKGSQGGLVSNRQERQRAYINYLDTSRNASMRNVTVNALVALSSIFRIYLTIKAISSDEQ